MSKRKGATRENVLDWLARGDGQGEGPNYKPFFHVRDIPSRGRSHMVEGLKTARTQHYPSDIEYGYHVLAEYATKVIDIREQYALLPWEEPQMIAESLGIEYPVYRNTDTPRVMTSDIVMTIREETGTELSIISVGPASTANPERRGYRRALEKLLIEKIYWQSRTSPWARCTEKMLPVIKVRNLDLLRVTMVSRECDWLNPQLPEFTALFQSLWNEQRTLNDLLSLAAKRLKIKVDDAFTLFGRSVWMRLLPIDLETNVVAHEFPVSLITPDPRGPSKCIA
jgi:TnsA-like endonuclease N terminal